MHTPSTLSLAALFALGLLTAAAPAPAQELFPANGEIGSALATPRPPVAAQAQPIADQVVPFAPQAQPNAAPPVGELGDVVLHAAGGLVLMVPPGWHVTEVPWVREERLVLTPAPLTGARRMPRDGVWLTYHYRPEHDENEPPLAEIVVPRLQLAADSRAELLGPPVEEQIDGWPACRQAFRLPPKNAGEGVLLGQHIVIRTPWGIVEIHASYPESLAAEREAVLRPMVARLKLAAPQPPAGPVDPSVAAAAEAFGAWKAYAARMEFQRDGRVTMYFDNRQLRPLDEQPAARVHITGRFQAEGDLILVTWDDGSQQNFRWQRAGYDLVLTDHTGQVSALRRVFQ